MDNQTDNIPDENTQPQKGMSKKLENFLCVIAALAGLGIMILIFGLIFSIGDTTFGEAMLWSLKIWGGMGAFLGLSMGIGAIIALIAGESLDEGFIVIGGVILIIIIALAIAIF